jgi:hypothetical protein
VLRRQPSERAIERVPEDHGVVGRVSVPDWRDIGTDDRRAGSSAACPQDVATSVGDDGPEPRLEAVRVAKRAHVAPRLDERVLDHVGRIIVADDRGGEAVGVGDQARDPRLEHVPRRRVLASGTDARDRSHAL